MAATNKARNNKKGINVKNNITQNDKLPDNKSI